MKKNSFVYKSVLLLIAMLAFCQLAACGKAKTDQELVGFLSNMDTFYQKISEKNKAINAISPSDSDSSTQLLTVLDEMKEDFIWLDSIPVPEEYGAVDQFANEAMQYMNEAVKLYHQAFAGDSNYENILVAAKENYRRANLRVSYMSDILQGKEPEIEGAQNSGQE